MLRFIICAGTGLVSTTYWLATLRLLEYEASALTIRSIAAPGAMLLARVTSAVASN
jgi:hypothetical protein